MVGDLILSENSKSGMKSYLFITLEITRWSKISYKPKVNI